MTPAQADSQFIENAKRLSMYGVDLHHAKVLANIFIENEILFRKYNRFMYLKYLLYNMHGIVVCEEKKRVLLLAANQSEGRFD